MNKKVLIASASVFGVVVLVFLLSYFKTTSKGSQSQNEQSTIQSEPNQTVNNERYVEYSPAAFAVPSEKKVLFFYASWCPTCRPVDLELTQNFQKIPDNVRIIRVNYNDSDVDGDERALARKYEVTYQHTFVLTDAQGNEIKKWNGGDLSTILTNIN